MSQPNEALLEKLKGGDEHTAQAADAINRFTRGHMRQGLWWSTRVRPWLLAQLKYLTGSGPNPGQAPPAEPPDDYQPELTR